MHNNFWQSKTAVVCGASAGLGHALAEQLLQVRVGRLVVLARGPAVLEASQRWADEFTETEVTGLTTDVCDIKQLNESAKSIQTRMGEVDLIINAVGRSDRGTLTELNPERLQDLFDVNVVSSLNVLQHLGPLLRRPNGKLVLIGSLASLFAPRFLGGYAIAKHALAGLAQQARLELAEQGIDVTLVCPGPIARVDAGQRYADTNEGLPAAALQPGGGAQIKGLDGPVLARQILRAAAKGQPILVRPRSARLLWTVSSLSPALGDWILRKKTS